MMELSRHSSGSRGAVEAVAGPYLSWLSLSQQEGNRCVITVLGHSRKCLHVPDAL